VRNVVSLSGGKDSTATATIALERCPSWSIELVTCDTGNEHPLTYQYLDYLEQKFGRPIRRLKADFTEDFARVRARLAEIAAGAKEKQEYKYPWDAEGAARALEHLHPTGNPYLDLCMLKGCFPSRKRQFCTEYLKVNPSVEYQDSLLEAGHRVVSWQGVRAGESEARRNLQKRQNVGGGLTIYRPILTWTADQVFAKHRECGIDPNPLYKMGMSRVGCMPCINERKDSLREIAIRWPEHIDRIREWERIVNLVARPRCGAGFFYTGKERKGVDAVVEWSMTTRGGRQYDLMAFVAKDEPRACQSAYGLCE
jgi:3'-phosphoadenosine 5'-phosphosulfate sulfotransferase (PAPS reductase)/FAD synthetase